MPEYRKSSYIGTMESPARAIILLYHSCRFIHRVSAVSYSVASHTDIKNSFKLNHEQSSSILLHTILLYARFYRPI